MADNVTVDNGALTDYTVATDEEVGVGQHPYTKVEFGPDGTFTKVTATTGLPVNPVQETAGVGVGAAADAEATANGSVIAILKRIRTLLGGTLVVDGSAVTQPTSSVAEGATTDAEATGNGSVVAILKRLRTLLGGGLPAALVGGRLDVNVGATALPAVITVEAAYTAAQTDAAIVTVAAPDRIVVTRVDAVLDEACTVGVGFRIGFGTVNTPTTTGVVASHPGMVPGGGLAKGDGSGVLGIGASDEDLRITSEVPTGGSLRVVVSYYLTT